MRFYTLVDLKGARHTTEWEFCGLNTGKHGIRVIGAVR